MNTRAIIRLVPALIVGQGIASAEVAVTDDALRPIAYLNGVNQDTLATETAALARSVRELMDELRRNGFPEQSLDGLRQLVDQLNALGAADMAALGERLRGLGSAAGDEMRRGVSDVYVAQQAVEARLKALANKIAIRQLREETVRRLEGLIARQLAAQRETRLLGAASASAAERRQLLVSDQRGVGEDLDAFLQTGESLLSALRETVEPGAAQAAAAPVQGFAERVNAPLLKTYAGEALNRVEASSYGEADARQNALLAELNKILQGVLSSQSKEQRLSSALMQVSALRQEQQARDEAKKTEDAKELQSAADEAKVIASKLAGVDPEAAKALAEAQQALEKQAAEAAAAEAQDQTQANNQASTKNQSTEKNTAEQQAQASQQQQAAQPSQASQSLAKAEAQLRTQLAAAQAAEKAQQNQSQLAQNGRPQDSNSQSAQDNMKGSKLDAKGAQDNIQGGDNGGMIGNAEGGESGPAQTVGALNRAEREAMFSLRNERYPAEYAPWVQQYWRNLADEQ